MNQQHHEVLEGIGVAATKRQQVIDVDFGWCGNLEV